MSDFPRALEPLSVTMIADFACPWCRIGKANLDVAIAQWTETPVEVTFLPYFLDPTLPAEGKDFREHLTTKFQGAPIEGMFERVSEAGARSGIEFRWDLIGKSPNTTKAHQLMSIAPEAIQSALSTAIYDAYFRDGKDITDLDVLLELAVANGMDCERTRQRLEAGEGAAEAHNIAHQVAQQGVTGVPFFIFDGKLAVSGAQPASALLGAMHQAHEPQLTPAG